MKTRYFILCSTLLLIGSMLTACDTDAEVESPLLRMLSLVPDTPEYREYLTFGDATAWHTSWDIPRVDNLDELQNLGREPFAYWLNIMSRQTTPPDTLGYQYLMAEDQRSFYGFDLFNLDRYLLAGMPPEWITVVEFDFDQAQIAGALTASGYEAETLESGGALYGILDDYKVSLDFPSKTGRLGNLNRIALLDGQMVIAKATGNVQNALDAQKGKLTSLAENSNYLAAVKALEDPALKDTGELVGVILMQGAQFYALDALLGPNIPAEQLAATREMYTGQDPLLPPYSLVAFATRHTKGASYLILAVVFPKGIDADVVAGTLADRLQNYVSLVTRQPLDDRWTFEKATGVEAEKLPVALVVMRADDPLPTPEDAPIANSAVWSWIHMVVRRDLAFLTTE